MPAELDIGALRQVLNEEEALLSTETGTLPVNVGKLCNNRGLSFVYIKGRGTGCYLTKKQANNSSTFSIIVPDHLRGTYLERFQIAHELAHYLLISRGHAGPTDKSSYWRVEDVCDEFARRILLPKKPLLDDLQVTNLDLRDLLQQSVPLTYRYGVPWQQLTMRVTEILGNIHFLRLELVQDRFRVTGTSYPKKKEIGRYVDSGSSLYAELKDRFISQTGGRDEVYRLSDEAIKQGGIPSLAAAKDSWALRYRRAVDEPILIGAQS
jgi:Zn-dependent peptidase ImmA (M78 family)